MNGRDTPAVAGQALPERLQQLFRHTLRDGLLNPLIHIVQAHRAHRAHRAHHAPQAEGLPGSSDASRGRSDTSPDRSSK